MRKIREFEPIALFLMIAAIALDGTAWWTIGASIKASPARIYFLGVSKESSELVVLPENIKILVDAGPDQKILASLAKAMPRDDTSIDLAIISNPEDDHVGGFNAILDHYRVSAFLYDGRTPLNAEGAQDTSAWQALLKKIALLHIPLITAGLGDVIRYKTNSVTFLSPDDAFGHSASLADAALVESIKTDSMATLLTSDAGTNVEKSLALKDIDLHADVVQGVTFAAAAHAKIATSSMPNQTTEMWADKTSQAQAELHMRVLH